MEHNTIEVNEILEQRGKIYGSYSGGVKCRADMLSALDNLYYENNGEVMPFELQIMFSDLVLKLMRAVSDPTHIDSWVDLEGYAKLIKEYHNDKNTTNKTNI